MMVGGIIGATRGGAAFAPDGGGNSPSDATTVLTSWL